METVPLSAPSMIDLAVDAIVKARTAHDEILDALEDADVLGSAPPPRRMAWGCAIVARLVAYDEPWAADILQGEEWQGMIWPISVVPAGSLLLQIVTEGGESLPATPAVFKAIERAGGRILGLTSVLWDAHANGHLGDDDLLTCVDAALIPLSVRVPVDEQHPIPTTLPCVISASAIPSPLVLLMPAHPPELPW